MMRLNLLLGVGSGPPAPLGLHFWLRAVEAGVAFVIGLALLNWFMGRLGGRTRRTGGGGWGRRAFRPGALLSTQGPGPARANEVGQPKKEPPFVSMSGPVDIVWNLERPGRSVTPGWTHGATPLGHAEFASGEGHSSRCRRDREVRS